MLYSSIQNDRLFEADLQDPGTTISPIHYLPPFSGFPSPELLTSPEEMAVVPVSINSTIHLY